MGVRERKEEGTGREEERREEKGKREEERRGGVCEVKGVSMVVTSAHASVTLTSFYKTTHPRTPRACELS